MEESPIYRTLVGFLQIFVTVLKTVFRNFSYILRNVDRAQIRAIVQVPVKLAGELAAMALRGNWRDRLESVRSGIKEMAVATTFAGGPFIVLALTYWSAITVYQFVRVAKALKWRTNVAIGLGRDCISGAWKIVMRVWHGQEFRGFENIPSRGGALVVWFHGVIPVDYFGLIAEIQLKHGRMMRSIVDRCLTKIPAFHLFEEYLGCFCQGREYCIKALQDGEILGVAPGGSTEAIMAEGYEVKWGSRTGFSEVAIKAGVPVIPVFTQNIKQAYMTLQTGRWIGLYLFNTFRLPILPVYGGFPVKLVTHIGEPIVPAADDTPETFKLKVRAAVQDLIKKNQRPDMTVREAFKERWTGVGPARTIVEAV